MEGYDAIQMAINKKEDQLEGGSEKVEREIEREKDQCNTENSIS